jgi:hypothetical protein
MMMMIIISRFAAIFDCPYIWISGTEPFSSVLSLIDDTLNPSYHAKIISTHAPPPAYFIYSCKALVSLAI